MNDVSFTKRWPSGYIFVLLNGKRVGEISPTHRSTTYTCPTCKQSAEKDRRVDGYILNLDGVLWNNAGEHKRRGEPGYGGSAFYDRRLYNAKAKAVEVLA